MRGLDEDLYEIGPAADVEEGSRVQAEDDGWEAEPAPRYWASLATLDERLGHHPFVNQRANEAGTR